MRFSYCVDEAQDHQFIKKIEKKGLGKNVKGENFGDEVEFKVYDVKKKKNMGKNDKFI